MRIANILWTLSLISLLALVPACSSNGGGSSYSGGELDAPDVGEFADADAVTGNVRVIWKNLNPRNPDVINVLVNGSSELGQKLRSGRVTSTETRVITDEGMGALLEKFEEIGFDEHATPGLGLDNVPSAPDKRGIVVVERDGRVSGLMLTLNMGRTPIPRVYRDAKAAVMAVHGQADGLEIRVNTDADRVFKSPKIRMKGGR